MSLRFLSHLSALHIDIVKEGLFKPEHIIDSQQQGVVTVQHHEVINLCANNYLGLANHSYLMQKAKEAIDMYGYGMASVRFICGTQTPHKALEKAISQFLKQDDTILYSSCFDANTGLFETILSEDDAIISDSLNHASIIDGVRLCKAKRFRYQNNDMADLENQLIEAQSARFRLIATDGIFSMDGIIANLKAICDLADKYDALVMVDDSHAVGFMGKTGRGTPEHCGVMDRIHLLTGTLGKALGGASGGYVSGKKEIIALLRQRSRPYLFSNTLAPVIAKTSIDALQLISDTPSLRETLFQNTQFFRERMTALGFDLVKGEHPIIPVMLYDAKVASEMAKRLLAEGVYVTGFSYPVVPHGKARIRTQMSAAHSTSSLEKAIVAFEKIGRELNIID